MTPRILLSAAIGLAVTGSVVLAHQGVQNAAVMARMEGMKAIGAELKILGSMAKGETAFDAEAAAAAMAKVGAEAAQVPALFNAQEDDPKSEAAAAIWQNWDDFTAKATAMETAASLPVTNTAELGAAMQALGASCKACHGPYRE